MPNIKSAIKRVNVTKVKHTANRIRKSDLKTTLRTYREAVAANADNAQEILRTAISKVDQAAQKNLIHKNAASRKKAQLMKALAAASK